METCEQCGTTFEQSGSMTEVTTTRILCPTCLAERKKRLASRQSGGPSPTRSGPPADGNASLPSPRTAAQPPAKPAARPVPVRESRTAATAPPAKTNASPPAVEKPSRTPAGKSHAAKATAAGERANRKRKDEAGEAAHHHEPHHYIEQQEKKTILIGWIASGVLLVFGGGFIFKVYRQKSAENAAFEELKTRDVRFYDSIKDRKVTSDAGEAQRTLDEINEKRNEWKTSPYKGKIQDIAAAAAAFIQQNIERKRIEGDLADVQAKLANVDALTGEELNELRRRIDDLGQGVPLMGPEFPETLKSAKERIEARYLDALVQDAQKLASGGPENARAALTKFGLAEDEIQKAFADASTKNDKDRQASLRPKFQAVCEESDKLAAATFNDSLVGSTPWKDLLSGDSAGKWIASQTPGLNWRISGGVLEINYPDAASKSIPVISIGDTERWRDFVMQCEFLILSPGNQDPVIYFRAPATRIDDNYVIHERLRCGDELQLNQKYTMTVSLIGNKYQLRFEPEDMTVEPLDLTLSFSRKGGVALAIRGGCQMRITKMQIKELRATPQN